MAKPIFVIEVSKEVPKIEREILKQKAEAELGEQYFVLVFGTSNVKDIEGIKYSIVQANE